MAITVQKLTVSIAEAELFISKAKEAIKRLEKGRKWSLATCKETGAARRSSMDLTRSLACLRAS